LCRAQVGVPQVRRLLLLERNVFERRRVVVLQRRGDHVLLELLGGLVHRALAPRPRDHVLVGAVGGERDAHHMVVPENLGFDVPVLGPVGVPDREGDALEIEDDPLLPDVVVRGSHDHVLAEGDDESSLLVGSVLVHDLADAAAEHDARLGV